MLEGLELGIDLPAPHRKETQRRCGLLVKELFRLTQELMCWQGPIIWAFGRRLLVVLTAAPFLGLVSWFPGCLLGKAWAVTARAETHRMEFFLGSLPGAIDWQIAGEVRSARGQGGCAPLRCPQGGWRAWQRI